MREPERESSFEMNLKLTQSPPIRAFVDIVKEEFPEKGSLLELGSYQGETTVSYAPIVKEKRGTITIVDWFRGNIEHQEIDRHHPVSDHGFDHKPSDEIMNNLTHNLKEIDCEEITTIHKSKTEDAADLFGDESFDLIFVDAGHRYEDVIRDLELYYPKVKKGGVFCGHDFKHDGVRKAVAEYFNLPEEFKKILTLGNISRTRRIRCGHCGYWTEVPSTTHVPYLICPPCGRTTTYADSQALDSEPEPEYTAKLEKFLGTVSSVEPPPLTLPVESIPDPHGCKQPLWKVNKPS
jgi:hypothetical protein